MQEIIPKKRLGIFTLEDSLNKTLSIIKQNGNLIKQCDILLSPSPHSPIYLTIPSEHIKLRFNSHTQRLELIEKTFPALPSHFEYSFHSKLIFSPTNSSLLCYSAPDFQYINTIFGISQLPILLNHNTHAYLPYNGIGFFFSLSNSVEDSSKDFILAPYERLYKMVIFSERNISASLGKENSLLQYPAPLIKVDVDYLEEGVRFVMYNGEEWEREFKVYMGDAYEEVLHKMKNPNYVYYPKEGEGRLGSEEDCLLNYFAYGVDVFICGKRNTVKKIVLHCNNPQESKFGIYERANFVVEMKKAEIRRKEKKRDEGNVRGSRIVNVEMEEEWKRGEDDSVKEEGDEIKREGFMLRGNVEEESGKDDIKDKECEEDEIILIFPWTNFNSVLKDIPENAYTIFQKHDNKIKRVNKYYVFDNIAFETLDDGTLNAITLFE